VASAAVATAVVMAASFFPAARLWGVNHLAFVPPALRLAAIALLAVAFLPAVARPIYAASLRAFASVAAWPVGHRRALVVALAVASIPVFWAGRSSTLLLGDGQLLVRSFEAAEEGHESVIMRSPGAIIREERIAPGTTLLYYAATQVSTDMLKKTPLPGMRMLNCLLGGVLVLMLGMIATGRFAGTETRLWLAALAAGSCSMVLFFGYIENYTLPTLLLAVYVVLAMRALHNRGPAWAAALPLAAAVYAHIQSVLFVPSFVYLLLWKYARARRALLVRSWMTAFSSLTVVGVALAGLLPSLRPFYVPFGFSNDAYAVFSPDHLADVANEIGMLLPILPVVAAMAWIGRRAERAAGTTVTGARAVKDPAAWFTHPCEWQFAATILVPCALYLGLFHPAIGMARDWDLFTMSTTAIVPMVLLVLGRYVRATSATPATVARFAVPSLLLLVVTTGAWVAVNASLPRTVDRFERILTYDHTHASYAWENLAVLQHDRGELERAIATMQKAVEHSRNPRQIVRLAVYLDEAGRTPDAKTALADVLARRPDFTKARFRLIMILEREDAWGEILGVARGGVEHNPEEGIYHFFYGEALMRAGQTEAGLAVFRTCAAMDIPESIKKHVMATLAAHGAAAPR
jgi:hypothetical protein